MNPYQNDTPLCGGGQGPIKLPKVLNNKGLLKPRTLDREGRLLPVQARKIPPKPFSLSGYIAFKPMGILVEFESSLERDSLLILKESEERLGILTQPLTLDRRALESGRGEYTPDLLVWTVDRSGEPIVVTLVEIKPEQDLRKHWSKIKPKLLAAHRFARMQGWRFVVVTERHLRQPLPIPATWSRRPAPKFKLATSDQYLTRLFGAKKQG